MVTLMMMLLNGCVYHQDSQDTDATAGGDLDCVDCCWDDKDRVWEECDQPDDTAVDTGSSDTGESPANALSLDPDHVKIGKTHILSLLGDEGMDDVTDLTFVGDVEVLAWTARDDTELIVTLDVPVSASPGVVDLIVDYRDGHAELVNDALTLKDVGDP